VRVALYEQPSHQQQKGCPMTRLILTSLALAISILPSYGQNSLHTDRSGYTTGTVGGSSQNTYWLDWR
jgi:hypothetical protein